MLLLLYVLITGSSYKQLNRYFYYISFFSHLGMVWCANIFLIKGIFSERWTARVYFIIQFPTTVCASWL